MVIAWVTVGWGERIYSDLHVKMKRNSNICKLCVIKKKSNLAQVPPIIFAGNFLLCRRHNVSFIFSLALHLKAARILVTLTIRVQSYKTKRYTFFYLFFFKVLRLIITFFKMLSLIKFNCTLFVLLTFLVLLASKITHQLPLPQILFEDGNINEEPFIFASPGKDDGLKMIAVAPTINSRTKSGAVCEPPARLAPNGKCKLPFGVTRSPTTTTKRPSFDDYHLSFPS